MGRQRKREANHREFSPSAENLRKMKFSQFMIEIYYKMLFALRTYKAVSWAHKLQENEFKEFKIDKIVWIQNIT